MFADKKSTITSQIKHDIKEYNGIKFFDDNKVDEFYDSQVAYLQTWIEKFAHTASGLEIAHCMKLYLNIAKYEPLKGSSYIPLPEALANKKQ